MSAYPSTGPRIPSKTTGNWPSDIAELLSVTSYVMGAPEEVGGSGDPSPRTALGCFSGISATVRHGHRPG
jgi:leucine dehydrogenase